LRAAQKSLFSRSAENGKTKNFPAFSAQKPGKLRADDHFRAARPVRVEDLHVRKSHATMQRHATPCNNKKIGRDTLHAYFMSGRDLSRSQTKTIAAGVARRAKTGSGRRSCS
jgi:hypothetical protein